MLEVDVHQQLHAFLRARGEREAQWPHYLSAARLVARALRLHRSALIQVSAAAQYRGHHCCSYLVPLLMWSDPVILVAPVPVQQRLLHIDIPQLSESLEFEKPVCTIEQWPGPHFTGLLLLSPQEWLEAELVEHRSFSGTLTLVDGVDSLEHWTRQSLTISLRPQDWEQLRWCYPHLAQRLRETRAQLTRSIFQHPTNPYACALLTEAEGHILNQLDHQLQDCNLSMSPKSWQQFWQCYHQPDQLTWAEIHRQRGSFTLHCAPINVRDYLRSLWSQQTVVLIGQGTNARASAQLYEHTLGLQDLTCVQFAADRQTEAIQLFIPDGLPMPNTPEFQARLVTQIHGLLAVSRDIQGPTVLVVDDSPLKAQVAALCAAEFGSRVQMETEVLEQDSILVTGWAYWLQVQHRIPAPPLLVIATLPIPSLEDPRVAGRVAYYKRRRQDWFRLYLLPQTLSMLQSAIAPARDRRGVVALLDNRVIHRSYGQQILDALSPYARINYLEPNLFTDTSIPLLDRA